MHPQTHLLGSSFLPAHLLLRLKHNFHQVRTQLTCFVWLTKLQEVMFKRWQDHDEICVCTQVQTPLASPLLARKTKKELVAMKGVSYALNSTATGLQEAQCMS